MFGRAPKQPKNASTGCAALQNCIPTMKKCILSMILLFPPTPQKLSIGQNMHFLQGNMHVWKGAQTAKKCIYRMCCSPKLHPHHEKMHIINDFAVPTHPPEAVHWSKYAFPAGEYAFFDGGAKHQKTHLQRRASRETSKNESLHMSTFENCIFDLVENASLLPLALPKLIVDTSLPARAPKLTRTSGPRRFPQAATAFQQEVEGMQSAEPRPPRFC